MSAAMPARLKPIAWDVDRGVYILPHQLLDKEVAQDTEAGWMDGPPPTPVRSYEGRDLPRIEFLPKPRRRSLGELLRGLLNGGRR